MRATLMYGAGDVRVENVPDSVLELPTDALVRVTAACICGSDLWPYAGMAPGSGPARMGHEFIGVVEDAGSQVTTVRKGDLVIAPWIISDGTCDFCREGRQNACEHLSTVSPEFRTRWAAHDVLLRNRGTKTFKHPVAGPIELAYHSMELPASTDAPHVLTSYTAEPGSATEEQLRLLASWTVPEMSSTVDPR